LGDVKRVLNRSNFKYYCKAVDPDTGGFVSFFALRCSEK